MFRCFGDSTGEGVLDGLEAIDLGFVNVKEK
jgi:hypothetical protein